MPWVEDLTGEHLCVSRTHQARGDLATAYFSSPCSHPSIHRLQDTLGLSWPLLLIPGPPNGISLATNHTLSHSNCLAARQTGLSLRPKSSPS